MKILIIEDEKPAYQHLESLLKRHNPQIEIIAHLKSVKASVEWFKTSPNAIDLIFMDIQLADGLSFDIFKHTHPQQPIIFTTAFNKYALEAFNTNGIAYLLKPVTFSALEVSMGKLELLKDSLSKPEQTQLELLSETLQNLQKTYKQRFMVKLGERIRSVEATQISFFYAEGRTVFLNTKKGGKFIVDYKMEQLQEMLDPSLFFRVNRSFMVNFQAIEEVVVYSKSRLKVSIHPAPEKEMIVSREKVSSFKRWFDDATDTSLL